MSMQHMDPNDFLMGSGGKSWSFDQAEPGTVKQGTVKRFEVQQQRDFATKLPKFFDDGGPMNQLVITLDTPERDPNIENDDGVRRDYVKGGDQAKALADACREGGLPNGLVVGATYARRYDGLGIAKGNLNPPKLYTFKVAPPSQQAATQAPQQAPQPAPAPQAPTPQAVQPVGVADLFG